MGDAAVTLSLTPPSAPVVDLEQRPPLAPAFHQETPTDRPDGCSLPVL